MSAPSQVEHAGFPGNTSEPHIDDTLEENSDSQSLLSFSFAGSAVPDSVDNTIPTQQENPALDAMKIFANNASVEKNSPTSTPALFGGRRFSVSAESMDPTSEETFEKKKIFKTDNQKSRIYKALESNFLFRNLDEDSYNDVVDAMEEIQVEPNTEVITQGGIGDYFYIIESGKFEVYKYKESSDGSINSNEDPALVAKIENGGSFGELALMYNSPRSATVKSSTTATLWALDRITFRRLLMERTSRKRKLYEKFLEGVPVLQNLESYERQKIADSLESVTYLDGEVVIKQGDKGDCFYLIEDGEAQVIKSSENNEPRYLDVLKKGSYFGELALLGNDLRRASIVAHGKLKCAKMSKDSFDRLLGPIIKTFRRQSYNYFE
ncbi:hypothetical protein BB561_003382 [Smittium simulii]|uniref:cAMP-dependent protein kinase regulatory subunit n=1 Tax=Smittium simulii TaxID=133385 RepID=A0A2T9YLK8_9FUNG|nr:hypothetical protein BB561_003382 [Smittium simulii]